MARYEPTREMRDFAKEACRVSALNKAGLSTDEDFTALERLGDRARTSQEEANRGR